MGARTIISTAGIATALLLTSFLTFATLQEDPQSTKFLFKFGTRGGGNGEFNNPVGIAVDSSGNIIVADTNNHRIQTFDSNGNFIRKWGNHGSDNGQFILPYGIAVDNSGNIYVADHDNHRIQKINSSGKFDFSFGSHGTVKGQFREPRGVAVDSSGSIYVADYHNHRIQKFTNDSNVTSWLSASAGSGFLMYPSSIAIDSSGNVYVTDNQNNLVLKFDNNGRLLKKWGSSGTKAGQFSRPSGITVDSSGYVYVADTGNHRFQIFDTNGNLIFQLGSYCNILTKEGCIESDGKGQFNNPSGIAVDSNSRIYISDTNNHRIQVFSSFQEVIDGVPPPRVSVIPTSMSFKHNLDSDKCPNFIETLNLHADRQGTWALISKPNWADIIIEGNKAVVNFNCIIDELVTQTLSSTARFTFIGSDGTTSDPVDVSISGEILKESNGSQPIPDDKPPSITLLGSDTVDTECSFQYKDAGATASDEIDGNLTLSIVVKNTVNTAIKGTYKITYDVTDSSGNRANTLTRTVNVVDSIAPSITPPADISLTVIAQSLEGVIIDLGIPTINDMCDDKPVITNDAPSIFSEGKTIVKWTATDSSRNVATAKQSVNIVAPSQPDNSWATPAAIGTSAGTGATILSLKFVPKPLPKVDIPRVGRISIRIRIRLEIKRGG